MISAPHYGILPEKSRRILSFKQLARGPERDDKNKRKAEGKRGVSIF
jgi:hypothetical protein